MQGPSEYVRPECRVRAMRYGPGNREALVSWLRAEGISFHYTSAGLAVRADAGLLRLVEGSWVAIDEHGVVAVLGPHEFAAAHRA